MMYVILIPLAVVGIWILGKMSKPACALAGLVGACILTLGAISGSLETMAFGGGLFGLCVVIFLAFNRGNW